MPTYSLDDLSDLWWDCHETEEGRAIEAELAREVADGHALRNVAVQAVALRRRKKEALFWLPGDERWAVVHLTWSTETDPRWPTTELAKDWPGVLSVLDDWDRR